MTNFEPYYLLNGIAFQDPGTLAYLWKNTDPVSSTQGGGGVLGIWNGRLTPSELDVASYPNPAHALPLNQSNMSLPSNSLYNIVRIYTILM